MGSNIIELAKLGHERAAELKASCGAVDVRSLAQLISDLATQLEVQFVRSTNMAVQLANAESKCRELAAENAGQKQSKPSLKAMMSALDAFYADEDVPESAMLIAFNILRGGIETPATDAFLAEVRAHGVEMYAEHLTRKAIASGENKNHAYAYLAANFAAQLRKGADL
ncbi:hypothetical protein RBT00_12930 [Citrobacter freundii]|uniref:hypothetical protein n=1 Tax=Citrobacter freundii TaxID=546 RepID=UPI0027E49284|nr:hypothetical protein [Citrobacter freundii]WME25051.1 hypothetical protein RBT00_12930 [Citrobacter freundii]